MSQGSLFRNDKAYFQSFFAENHRTVSFSEENYNESMPVSLNSMPETLSIRSSHDGDCCSQTCTQAVVPPRVEGELCSVYEIPRKFRHIFNNYPCFNSVQSRVLDDVLYSDTPVVVSAPTGSGKTVIFELAIIRLLMKLDEIKYDGHFIIVYMAPVKALCSERYFDWKTKFSSLGINCQEVTGDTDDYALANLPRSHLILTTPEKWDSLTRKWKDNTKMVQLVKLFLIDEVHLLSEEKRGPTLEAVVSRMKTITDVLQKQNLQNMDGSADVRLPLGIRFMAVSATIYNIEDVAGWLGTSLDSPAKYCKISEEQRPVKLQKIVIGYPCPNKYSQFRFEISLSFRLRPLLFKYAEGKPTLIFCSTRKGVDQTCNTLSQQITFSFNEEHRRQLLEAAQTLSENKLKSYIVAGVGYHHAGMDRDDRHAVENLFRAGLLPVLVTTSTLAIGVNLPAHLVIIKATQQYAGGAYHDYTETQILQMIGRAGRPQYDTSAVAIIMTKESQKSRYENLIEGKEPLESNLHRHLAEHLNSEVVLHTITEVGHAMEWIRSTFLYVRALQNPHHYGIPATLSKKGIETKLQEMCQRELNALASANLLTVDNLTDIRPTANGAIMARFYLGLGTMKIFKKVTGQETLEDLLKLIAACDEFSGLKLRVNEKKNLNLLNKSKDHETIRFPLQGKISNTEMKVNCLIQALFGCLPVFEQSLKQDMLRISWTGERVTMALCQYLLQYKHYKVLLHANILAKCFHCKLWENSPYVSRQLKGIGPALSSLLVASQKTSFQAIANSNPRDIELILNRAPPMGDALKAEVSRLPKFEVKVDPVSRNANLTTLHVYCEITNKHLVEEYNAAGGNHWLVLILGASDNRCLLIERFRDNCLLQNSTFSRSVTVKHTASTEIYINLISEQWVGLDVSLTTKFDEPSPAKHTLDQYLLKMGIDSSGKSALQISSEAASLMKKRKRNSLSQVINTINEKSYDPGNRLTLDRFKFTTTRHTKLAPSQQCVSNNTVHEKMLTETKDLDDSSITTFEHMDDTDDQNMPDHLPYADVQSDAATEKTILERHYALENNQNHFIQPQKRHCLQERNVNCDTHKSVYCHSKYDSTKTMEEKLNTADNAEMIIAKKIDPKLPLPRVDSYETMDIGTEVLLTEPSETFEAPYITYAHNSFNTEKENINKASINVAESNHVKYNITDWNKLIKSTKFNESHPKFETIDLTQDSSNESYFTEDIKSTQTSNTEAFGFHHRSASNSHHQMQAMQGSSNGRHADKSESIPYQNNAAHKTYKAQKFFGSTESFSSLGQESPSANPDGSESSLGSEDAGPMIKPDAGHFQNKSLENDISMSEDIQTRLSNPYCRIQVNKGVDRLVSDVVENEQTFKKTLDKRFYPIFMKPASVNDTKDKDDEKGRIIHTESANIHNSAALQMETASSPERSLALSQPPYKQAAFKNTQGNEPSNALAEEARKGSCLMESSSPAPQLCEDEHINTKLDSTNDLQLHSINSELRNPSTKSLTENIEETKVESNNLAQMSSKVINLDTSTPFNGPSQKFDSLQPVLNFSLVADFNTFFEKLSSATQNFKDEQAYEHNTEVELKNLTPQTKYNKAWVRDYLFSRKTTTPKANENTRFAQDSRRNSRLHDPTVMHYSVPTFNKETPIKTRPLNYMEAGPYTKNELCSYETQKERTAFSCLKANNVVKFDKMVKVLNSNCNSNQSFTPSEAKIEIFPQQTDKSLYNSFTKPKHVELGNSPSNNHREFPDATESVVEYPSPHSFESSDSFNLHPQSSEVSDGPYIDSHKTTHKSKSNTRETNNNNSFLYEYSPEEIFHNADKELIQLFLPSNTHPHTYPEQQNYSSFNSNVFKQEEADEAYTNNSLEKDMQDYDKCSSPLSNTSLSNISPQNSDCCDLPSPPLELSPDESDNCSQCSSCQAASTIDINEPTQQLATTEQAHVFSNNNTRLSLPSKFTTEDAKLYEDEPQRVPEMLAKKQHTLNMFSGNNIRLTLPPKSNMREAKPYQEAQIVPEQFAPKYSLKYTMANIPASLLLQPPISNSQQAKQKYPAMQQDYDSEYKRPRSIYFPNDKLQKFYPIPPSRRIKFSPAYRKMKWLP